MDPNENLKEQLALARTILAAYDNEDGVKVALALQEDAQRLAELVIDLNNWLAASGFAPTYRKANA